jgi:1,4-dihydroxy-2-naphthoate polyprenyltransferase
MTILAGTAMERPSTFRIWYLAARPWTLPASLAPIIVGSAVAWHEGGFHALTAMMALLTALLLQIAANFANDALDFKKGADTDERVGPTRITSAGYVSYEGVMRATFLTLGLAVLTGLYLVYRGGWPFLLLGIFALVAAVAYTGGPFPISYLGLGEIFVFLFFGLIAVTGTAYLQTGEVTALSLWSSLIPGALIVGILVVNNYRDLEGDRAVNKRTVAVRIGPRNTRLEYALMLLVTALTPLVFWAVGWLDTWALLTLLAWPLLWQLWRQVTTLHGPALNKTLGMTGRVAVAASVLFSIALVLS